MDRDFGKYMASEYDQRDDLVGHGYYGMTHPLPTNSALTHQFKDKNVQVGFEGQYGTHGDSTRLQDPESSDEEEDEDEEMDPWRRLLSEGYRREFGSIPVNDSSGGKVAASGPFSSAVVANSSQQSETEETNESEIDHSAPVESSHEPHLRKAGLLPQSEDASTESDKEKQEFKTSPTTPGHISEARSRAEQAMERDDAASKSETSEEKSRLLDKPVSSSSTPRAVATGAKVSTSAKVGPPKLPKRVKKLAALPTSNIDHPELRPNVAPRTSRYRPGQTEHDLSQLQELTTYEVPPTVSKRTAAEEDDLHPSKLSAPKTD
jgi:hypothetical protein